MLAVVEFTVDEFLIIDEQEMGDSFVDNKVLPRARLDFFLETIVFELRVVLRLFTLEERLSIIELSKKNKNFILQNFIF